LRLCILVGIDCSCPKSHYTSFLDLRFKSYEVLKISAKVQAYSQPLPMQQILPKTAKMCPKMKHWNATKNQDFSFVQKQKFVPVEEVLEYISTVWILNPGIFICYFYCQKGPLYVNFSLPPCGNWWYFQSSTPHVGMGFCGHVHNSPRNKNLKRLILNLLENLVFLDPKRLMSPFGKGQKKHFFNFECYDLTNGNEWECEIW
jgi:hypothetical protein